MTLLIVLAVALVIIGALIALKKNQSRAVDGAAWPFYVKKPLTQPEQILFHRLVAALPDHLVLAQVQLSRVLGVKKGASFNEWNNRINRLSLDFVACLKDSTVVAAIELDDATHRKPSRIETDLKKEKALAAAGVKLVRWRVEDLPDATAIRQAIVNAI